ncbi:thioesterase family protein [Sporosarcina sp. ZBG7A]|uniref:thioesterase family protein n=1 Tax=Sporosarcina sp. ZBG7A TaxID=1582223 RepID=UPI00057AE58C|nr:thioesterase family protein [Sporosarcina sp. ZBG7A]
MEKTTFTYSSLVQPEWVDYNGHMNDAAYSKVFSLAVDAFMEHIDLHEQARTTNSYTLFTLETHICYLLEANEGERLTITMQLLDTDEKRVHIFFNMWNSGQELVATSEQMLMGMNTDTGKPGPFPDSISHVIEKIASTDSQLELPKQAGRRIGIRR